MTRNGKHTSHITAKFHIHQIVSFMEMLKGTECDAPAEGRNDGREEGVRGGGRELLILVPKSSRRPPHRLLRAAMHKKSISKYFLT